MKKYLSIIFLILILVSCKKSDTTPSSGNSTNTNNSNTNNSSTTFAQLFEKKWDVSSTSTGRVAGSSGINYKTFEFTTDSVYIITTTTDSVISGRYSINAADSIVTLTGYGTLHVLSISDSGIQFKLTLTTSAVVNVAASAATPVTVAATDTTTNKITRSWKVISMSVNGQTDTATTNAFSKGNVYAHITFTMYSTYYTEQYSGTGTATKNNGVWQWAASGDQSRICTADSLPIDCSHNSGIQFTNTGNLQLIQQSAGGVTPQTTTIYTLTAY